MDTSVTKDELTSQDGPQLAAQARAAYDKRRTKECLALAKQVLLLDPHNIEAKDLLAAVQSHIQQDFNDACALIEESSRMEDGRKHRKSAEIMLLRILYIDPAHAEAKALLASSKAFGPAPEAVTEAAPITPMPMMAPAPHDEEIAFTARPQPVPRIEETRPPIVTGRQLAMVLAAIVFLMGGILLFKSRGTSEAAGTATIQVVQPKTAPARPSPLPPVSKPEPAIAGPVAWAVAAPAAQPISMTKPAELEVAAQPGNIPAGETGSLAISSLLPADIFANGTYVGSTPTTLDLAPGRHSLEYRYGDLRTVMTHVIKSKQTTTALVAFEVPVQINARPWAQVFLEGANRKSLGQTPIASVRVPIGGVLTFENPNFPSKSHRVMDTDSTVRMVFP